MDEKEKELLEQQEKEAKEKEEAEAKAKETQEDGDDEDDEDDDEDFISSLLNDDDEDDDDDEEVKKKAAAEEERRKNKDAEEARKRREAEAKAKAEEEAKKKAEEEALAKAKADEEAKKKDLDEDRSAKEKKLGEQLVEFKKKHPNVDLGELDKDKNFKRFIDGKLLGKKDFTGLYEDFVDFKSELGGVTKDIVQKNYQKANSSSGSSGKGGGEVPTGIYSEAEMDKIAQKLPFMSRQEAAKVTEKLEKSIAYYEKK